MVEKIDKPEPPPPYYVQATNQPKRDRGGSAGQSEQQFDEYSGLHAAPGWQQIYASAANRRYMKLKREDIMRVWLRTTIMQRGVFLAEVDVQIGDGRIIKNAHIILTAREDFWTLKRFQPGQDIPLNMIIKDPIVEISVPPPRPVQTGQALPVNTTPARAGGLEITKKLFAKYGVIALVVLFLAVFLLTRC